MVLDERVYGWCIDDRVIDMILFCLAKTNTGWEHRVLLIYYVQELGYMISMLEQRPTRRLMDIYTSTMSFKEIDRDSFLLTKNIEVSYNVSCYL